MTDRYERIRAALAKELTPGPWEVRDARTDTVESAQGYPVCTVHWYPDERYGHGSRAAYIAACDPDTIRALLEERDALAAKVARAQARIDALMLEYCPDEMTPEQVAEWVRHQRPVSEQAAAAIDAARQQENRGGMADDRLSL